MHVALERAAITLDAGSGWHQMYSNAISVGRQTQLSLWVPPQMGAGCRTTARDRPYYMHGFASPTVSCRWSFRSPI